MKFKKVLLLEDIKPNTPYMLTREGKLLSIPNGVHPYLDPDGEEITIENLHKVLDEYSSLKWFYDNTRNKETKEDIKLLIEGIFFNQKQLQTLGWNEEFQNIYRKEFEIPSNYKNEYGLKDIINLANVLRHALNDEFCRVRTSNKYWAAGGNRDIYFRISSYGFNWFNIIWKICYENKNFISTVTIVEDKQTRGYERFYNLSGEKTDHLPIDDFLNLSGNPIVEKYQPQLISESFRVNPYWMVWKYKNNYDKYMDKDFI